MKPQQLLMVTLPPVKGDSPPDGGVSTTIVEPFRAGANWMTHVPGSLFVAMIASWIEIPSGPGLATSAFTEDVSPFTTTVAFVAMITVPRLRTTGGIANGGRRVAFRADPAAVGGQLVRWCGEYPDCQ